MCPTYKLYKAIELAEKAHKWQIRSDWESFINHPMYVLKTLSKLDLKKEILITGILHDVVENSKIKISHIYEEYWNEVGFSVDSLTKNYYKTKKLRMDNYIKKLEIWIIFHYWIYLVKLIDVLHNIQSLSHCSKKFQKKQLDKITRYYLPLFHNYLYKVHDKFKQFVLEKLEIIKSIALKIANA